MRTTTTVSLPVEVKVKSDFYRIGISQTLREALIAKIEELERAELAGMPEPERPEGKNRGRFSY